MPPVAKNGYVRFTQGVKELKAAKEALREEDYPPAKVKALVRTLLKQPVQFPPDSVLIPAPSTSGNNTIPYELCMALAKGQDVRIVDDRLDVLNETKAANKGAIGKLRDPVRIVAAGDFADLAGKTVFIVDDVVTTGETTDAIRECLAGNGIFASGVISLGQSEIRHGTGADFFRIAGKLGDPPLNEEIKTVLDGRLKHRANYIEREINERNRLEIREYFVAEAKRLGQLDERTRNYLGSSKAVDHRLQFGQQTGTKLRTSY